jgi:hypothetical protein
MSANTKNILTSRFSFFKKNMRGKEADFNQLKRLNKSLPLFLYFRRFFARKFD